MTTNDPMSCCAITFTASRTEPLGGVVNRALPLIRRISLTSISPPWVSRVGVAGVACLSQVTPGVAPHATRTRPRERLPRQRTPFPDCLCQCPAVDVLQLAYDRHAARE